MARGQRGQQGADRSKRIETRWTSGRHPGIRVWFPGRSYRDAVALWLTVGEAEALVRNVGRRLAEGPPPPEERKPAGLAPGAEGTGGRA